MYQTPPTEAENTSTSPVIHPYSQSIREIIGWLGVPINESGRAEGVRIASIGIGAQGASYASSLEGTLYRVASALVHLGPEDAKLRTAHGLSIMLGFEEGQGR